MDGKYSNGKIANNMVKFPNDKNNYFWFGFHQRLQLKVFDKKSEQFIHKHHWKHLLSDQNEKSSEWSYLLIRSNFEIQLEILWIEQTGQI